MNEYNHVEIEKKWQERWRDANIFRTKECPDNKSYVLVEFPYPSGNLHVGHWYTFAGMDIYARYQRMLGKNVLYPIGFDSFGLPAENAAIKRNIDPRKWTYSNIKNMKAQLESMGATFDWDRGVITSDPDYYQWTQWIFTKMFERGLAYKKKAVVNWDPVDKTILANEQVMSDGTAERSGAVVEKKEMEQWFLKITDYAERLNEDLDKLDWPEDIKRQQKNWIGKSFGAEIYFHVKDTDDQITVFTTRPDTLFGATYVVLAPENSLIQKLKEKINNFEEVEKYINDAKQKKEIDRTKKVKDKTGIKIEGVRAINPANKKEIPIFVADYVLGNYGTGSVMAVPAHDSRDYDFAKQFGLPIVEVVIGGNIIRGAFEGAGIMINSGQFDGISSDEAKKKITKFVKGKFTTTYKLRDWSVGRQRYWGCPIPIVYDPSSNPHIVPEEHLPWLLPNDVDHAPTGEPPLGKSKELKERTEKIFGSGWKPEIETLDTFVDSSWYFLRYLDPKNNQMPVSKNVVDKWMPVDFYCGGAEHTTLHLLYSRFFNKFLFDIGISPVDEPYKHRMNHSMILGSDGNKMSKSKGNVVDPDEIVERLGADTVRMYLAFMGPYNEVNSYPWDQNGVVGVRRFLERVWRISNRLLKQDEETSENVLSELHKSIEFVTKEFSQLKFNTGIARMMSFTNLIEKEKISRADFTQFIKLLSAVSPHISEEIWSNLGNSDFCSNSQWPAFKKDLVKDNDITIAIQINGKVRDKITVQNNISEEEVLVKVYELESVKKWAPKEKILKTLYIKNRVVSIVVRA